jgi:hypothetical protein
MVSSISSTPERNRFAKTGGTARTTDALTERNSSPAFSLRTLLGESSTSMGTGELLRFISLEDVGVGRDGLLAANRSVSDGSGVVSGSGGWPSACGVACATAPTRFADLTAAALLQPTTRAPSNHVPPSLLLCPLLGPLRSIALDGFLSSSRDLHYLLSVVSKWARWPLERCTAVFGLFTSRNRLSDIRYK